MINTFDLLHPRDWVRLTDFLSDRRERKVKLTVTVKPYRKRRSIHANAYYWGTCIRPLAEHFGYRPEELHRIICGTYFGWERREFKGQIFDIPRRTSTTPETMDVVDFQGLIQTAQQIAAEEGITLPDQDHEETKETPQETHTEATQTQGR